MAVIVYSISNCPKCAAAKAVLKRSGIAFEEFNVQKSDERKKEMMQKVGNAEEVNAPVLDISGTIIQGFDREKILAALKENNLVS